MEQEVKKKVEVGKPEVGKTIHGGKSYCSALLCTPIWVGICCRSPATCASDGRQRKQAQPVNMRDEPCCDIVPAVPNPRDESEKDQHIKSDGTQNKHAHVKFKSSR